MLVHEVLVSTMIRGANSKSSNHDDIGTCYINNCSRLRLKVTDAGSRSVSFDNDKRGQFKKFQPRLYQYMRPTEFEHYNNDHTGRLPKQKAETDLLYTTLDKKHRIYQGCSSEGKRPSMLSHQLPTSQPNVTTRGPQSQRRCEDHTAV